MPTSTPCPRHRLALHADGPVFSLIVAGMWRMAEWDLTAQQRLTLIEQCIALGVTTFDHADIYGSYRVETLFGAALKLAPGLRGKLELVSKCGIALRSPQRPSQTLNYYDTGADHIIASAEQSLRNLQTDYLDLLLIHRPDPLMDFDQIAGTFTQLRDSGKVRHFGVSNFTPQQFACLDRKISLVTNQVEFSPLCLGAMYDGTFDDLQARGLAPMIWSPLAGGALFTGQTDAALRVRTALAAVAGELNASLASVAYAWIMRLPSRPLPLTGSGRIAAIADAVHGCTLSLSREQWFAILLAAQGHPVP